MTENDYQTDRIDIYFSENAGVDFIPAHYHRDYQILFVVRGTIEITIEERTYTAPAGSVIFITNLERHRLRILESPYHCYVISIPQNHLFMMPEECPLLSVFLQRPGHFYHVLSLDGNQSEQVRRHAQRMLDEKTEQKPFWETDMSCLLTEFLICLYRFDPDYFPGSGSASAANIVFSVQKYISRNYKSSISLTEAAADNFVSKYYLSHIFKDVTGYTFKEYVILYRMAVAKRLLLESTDSVAAISALAGYNSPAHFIKSFTALEGVSPAQYRKRAAE